VKGRSGVNTEATEGAEFTETERELFSKGPILPPPPVFLPKSSESLEKKGVAFCGSAKKCKKAQKSAEECENKGNDFFAPDDSADPSHWLGARECEKRGNRE
jgi:hypothetical protein